jgi:type II secretory ATPase GspE/PulE/Tfp pilus assembly ATPase PilB-like protein
VKGIIFWTHNKFAIDHAALFAIRIRRERAEIGTLVKYLLMDAVKARASDIHIEPWESTLVVRIRLNGVLTELVHLPLELMEK